MSSKDLLTERAPLHVLPIVRFVTGARSDAIDLHTSPQTAVTIAGRDVASAAPAGDD